MASATTTVNSNVIPISKAFKTHSYDAGPITPDVRGVETAFACQRVAAFVVRASPSQRSKAYTRKNYFFFSAFQMVRDRARPQNGQKLIGNKLGRSSGDRTA